MSFFRLIWQNLKYQPVRNLWVFSGIALSAAILSGALFIGDSVKYSLKRITLDRLGKTDLLISVSDRYFRSALADEMSVAIHSAAVPILLTEGSVIKDGGIERANKVQIIGADERLGQFSGNSFFNELKGNEIVINDRLARHLDLKEGDAILVKIGKVSMIPRNAPFVAGEDPSVSIRAVIRKVISASEMGNFNLKNSQTPPYNLFLSANLLNRLMEFENKANRILLTSNLDPEKIYHILDSLLQPVDVGLTFHRVDLTGENEISSERIFLEKKVTDEFLKVPGSRLVLTYFVNSLEFKGKEVPYAFVSSLPENVLPGKEIYVNSWAADDLGIAPGDSLKVSYFEIGPLRQLIEKKITLEVGKIVSMSGIYGDRQLMPRIPGLSDAGHCREWETGVPVNLDKIRDKDEDYWNKYKGTPKAFISTELAVRLWANRFGNSTAIRFSDTTFTKDRFIRYFSAQTSPSDFGFSVVPVKEEGLKAAQEGVDFGQLFLGLSFFLLVSAILLALLLLDLNLRKRGEHVATLLQIGFSRKQIFLIIISEVLIISVIGIVFGMLLSLGYVKIIFGFLNSLWWEIVRTPALLIRIKWQTFLAGFFLNLLVTFLFAILTIRPFLHRKIADLYKNTISVRKKRTWKWDLIALFCFGIAMILIISDLMGGTNLVPVKFFLSGGLLLVSLLIGFRRLNDKYQSKESAVQPLKKSGIFRNRPGRNFLIVVLLALGTFLTISTGSFKEDISLNPVNKSSGTGGYTYIGEVTTPVLNDLNDPDFRKQEQLDTSLHFVQFMRVDGDDASCLNLNRVSHPAILGVDASNLSGRFSFVSSTGDLDTVNPWRSLKKRSGEVIPAFADQTVIQWGLGLKCGDTLLYRNEKGDTLRIRLTGGLAPSIFQGYILIDSEVFLQNWPSFSGTQLFLTDIPAEKDTETVRELNILFRDHGIEITPTLQRLAEFNSVSNTYLSVFMALGFLGLLIGTAGISIVLARSVLERRHELSVLLAVGFSRKQLVMLLFDEYAFLLAAGTSIGLLTAVVSVLPDLITGKSLDQITVIMGLGLGILIHGMLWIYMVARFSIRPRKLIAALQNE